MSKPTISLLELFQMFPDADTARGYMEARRWPDGPICPACGEAKRIYERAGGAKRCNACLCTFSVRTGTIFEETRLGLHKWIYAMYLLITARKGISSVQLHAEIGVTQKTAWYMLQRLREACGNDPSKLSGIVEIDETYIGDKEGRCKTRVREAETRSWHSRQNAQDAEIRAGARKAGCSVRYLHNVLGEQRV